MEYNLPITTNIANKFESLYRHFDWIALALLSFILLIPKFPLFPVGGTYINIRVEDFVVAVVYLLWLFGWLAGRFSINRVFNRRVLIFFLVYGLVITALGVWVFGTVGDPYKLGFVHWARRVEYIGMYFIVATVARKANLHKYLYTLLIVGTITWVYGFLQWQDLAVGVHTLSKSGQIGTFSDLGYVISTFAAHYDFGAFLILMIMLAIWGYYSHTKWWKKILFVLLALAFWWMSRLVYGRAAYLGLLVGLMVVLAIKMSGWILLPVWEVLQTFDRYLGGRFSRYTYNFKFNILPEAPAPPPVPTPAIDTVASAPARRGFGGLVERLTGPSPTPAGVSPESGASVVTKESWIRVWLDQHVSAGSTWLRTWVGRLDVELDPSANIRLVEWQDALARVGYHFLWGGGYYTNGGPTNNVGGTDNDFVRHIVEVGVIGLAIFLLLIWDFVRVAWRSYRSLAVPHLRYFHLAMIGFIVGLLVEAMFIDIFESSKIAFLFWYLMGLVSLFAEQAGFARVEKE